MRFKGFYLFFCFLFFISFGFAQNDGTEVSRNEIFDRLEARAKSLANRMQEMAEQDTSQPVSPSNFPQAYTSPVLVPAPLSSQVAVPTPDPSESTRVGDQRPEEPLPDASTFTTIEEDNAEYIPTASSQELNGDYYIMPSLGFVLSSESQVTYKFGLNNENEVKDLDNEIGTGVGIKAGIRLDNFFTEFGIKYTSSDFKIHGALKSGTPYTGDGTADILNFNARLGYTFQINEQLGLSGSAGLGLANRKNSIDISVGPISDNIGSSETVFSYDIGFSLCYLINESHLFSLGYNYANVAKISQFDALNLHYFELGWGINF